MTDDWQQAGFGLYLHWPFCTAKCPYCDFNSHVAKRIDQAVWGRSYVTELRRAATETTGRVLQSVFFGGGTPSLMDPDVLDEIIAEIRRLWPVANDLEIALEANPGSVEAARFRAYRDAGVTRISMGIQALNDADLRRLGRLHTAREAMDAFDVARQTFDRVSFDLIYGRQDQTLAAWRSELAMALDMSIDHLSLYQLTIEPGTAFADRYKRGGLKGLPDEDLSADFYLATQDICGTAGLPAYEVSNHARQNASSRHNLIYWRYGDYVGIGPGAHGRLTLDGQKWATEAYRDPNRWLEGVQTDSAERPRMPLSRLDQAREFLLMGLRLKEGIDLERYARLAGKPLDADAVDELLDLGMISVEGKRLTVLDQGVMVLNAIINKLSP